jgi:DNA-binding MarR family transcriptional regulator
MIAHAMTTPTHQAPGAASASLALWQALAAAHAVMTERLDPEVGTCAVLGSDSVAVLLPLAEAPDHQLRMHELADRSHLTRSGLTRRVDRLVADGLVMRVVCPSDRRGAYAQVTPAGLAELDDALPHHIESLERSISGALDPSEVVTLTRLLQRLGESPSG